jgi:hypothetical protein
MLKRSSRLVNYHDSLQRLVALRYHPEPMPGVEHAVRDDRGRIVPAIEKNLSEYPTSEEGDRHTAHLAKLEQIVKPLLDELEGSADLLEQRVLDAATRIDGMWAEAMGRLPEILFLERETYQHDSMQFTPSGAPNATLRMFDPAGKKLRTVFENRSGRSHDISLSFDAKTIYIGGGGKVQSVSADGTGWRSLTPGQSPVEMPDGRLCFFDDYSGISPCKSRGPRRILFVCDADGKNRKKVSANLTIDNTPTVMNDGRIVFARWDYGVNKNVFNRHAIWTQNPDGTALDLYYGNTVIDPRAFYRPIQIPNRPEMLAVFGPHHRNVAGLLGLVWNGNGREAPDGTGFRRITHDTASVGDNAPVYAYQDPYPLNEQLFLVSFGGRADRQVGLYLVDRAGNKKPLLYTAGHRGVHSARPFVVRKRPPVIPDRTTNPNCPGPIDLHEKQLLTDPDWSQKGTLFLQDVYQGIEPEIRRGQVKYLAVMEQVALSHPRGGAIGVGTIWYPNRFIGLVPVEEDGSAHFEVPALRSLYFHVLDKDGRMLMTQGSDFHVMPGETRSCIGCHEQRKGIDAPPSRTLTQAARKSPVRPELPRWGTRGIIEYEAVVQPVFNCYCVSCHSGKSPKGRLDLSGSRTMVYNMSYMQLTDKALVHYVPGTGSTHAQPSNDYDEQAPLARGSVMSKLTRHMQDASHSKAKIPFDDQLKVFLWIDSNVPFYGHARQKSPVILSASSRDRLKGIYKRRCAECHDKPDRPDATRSGLNIHHTWVHAGGRPGQWGIADSGMRPMHFNLSKPEESAALAAPLATKNGGWGVCGSVFESADDPDYINMLDAIKSGIIPQGDEINRQGVYDILKGNRRIGKDK